MAKQASRSPSSCSVCEHRDMPMQGDEVVLSYSIVPIGARDTTVIEQKLDALKKKFPSKVCVHGMRVSFRIRYTDRRDIGLAIRDLERHVQNGWSVGFLADFLLSEGAFHATVMNDAIRE